MFRSRLALDLIDLRDALVGAAAVAWLLGFVVAVESALCEARLLGRSAFGGSCHAHTHELTGRRPHPDRPRRMVHGRHDSIGPHACGLQRPGCRGRGHPTNSLPNAPPWTGSTTWAPIRISKAARMTEADRRPRPPWPIGLIGLLGQGGQSAAPFQRRKLLGAAADLFRRAVARAERLTADAGAAQRVEQRRRLRVPIGQRPPGPTRAGGEAVALGGVAEAGHGVGQRRRFDRFRHRARPRPSPAPPSRPRASRPPARRERGRGTRRRSGSPRGRAAPRRRPRRGAVGCRPRPPNAARPARLRARTRPGARASASPSPTTRSRASGWRWRSRRKASRRRSRPL